MAFSLTYEQRELVASATRFAQDKFASVPVGGDFPHELVKEVAGHEWAGLCMPEDTTVMAAWNSRQQQESTMFPSTEQPVPTGGGGAPGRLVALGIDSPITDFDSLALERTVSVIALALLQSRQEALLASRERGDFLARLLDSDIHEAEASAQANLLGFPREVGPLLPMAMAPSPALGLAASDEAAWATTWRAVRQALGQAKLPAIVGSRGADRTTLAVVAMNGHTERSDGAAAAASIIQRIAGEHFHAPNPVVIVVGPMARTWGELGGDLKAAVEVVWPAAHAPQRPWHDVTEPDLDRLLWSLRDHSALDSFVRLRLKALIERDARRGSELMTTLRAYCANAGRRGDTARALNIERQTLYYRLERIEQLLGRKLTDGDTLLDVLLAVRAEPYLPRVTPETADAAR